MTLSVRVTCTGSRSIPLSELLDFQGDLKSLSEQSYQKLKKEILLHGMSFTIHAWSHKGKTYIIDGHQRVRSLRRMEAEGIKIPLIPISDVQASSWKEAKQKVLAGASQYGQVERDGLYQFLHESEIEFSEVNSLCEFPEIDLPIFHAEFYQETVAKDPNPREESPVHNDRSYPQGEDDIHKESTDDRAPALTVIDGGPDEPIGNFSDRPPPREPDGKEDLTYRFLPEEKQEMLWKCDELMKKFKVLSHAEVIFALVSDAHRKLKKTK